jgi:hypothetical protein
MKEQELYKSFVYITIEDYLRGDDYEKDRSARLLFGDGEWARHFQWMCDNAGYDVGYVKKRILDMIDEPLPKGTSIFLGRNVMGEWNTRVRLNRKDKKCRAKRKSLVLVRRNS